MTETPEDGKISIDGIDYSFDNLSDEAKSQIRNIKFSDEQILQLKNELAISNTARTGYLRALNIELARDKGATG